MVKTKDAVNDMTVGTPAKLIIQFMIPVFLGNIFQQFYNIADSIVAGQFIGVKALAAKRTKQRICNSCFTVVRCKTI